MKITNKQAIILQDNIYNVIRESEVTSDPFEAGDLSDSVYEVIRQVIEEGGVF